MHLCIYACMHMHVYTHEHTQATWRRTHIQNLRPGPPSDDQTRNRTRSLLLGRDHPHSRHPAHPPLQGLLAPSLVTASVWGDSHVFTEAQWHSQTQGAWLSFQGPCGLGEVTAVHLPVWKWSVRPLICKGPFCSDPSVTPWLGIRLIRLSCTITGWRGGCLPINDFHFGLCILLVKLLA